LTVNLVAQYLVSAKDIASPVIDQFAQMNLPVNLWPYAREVVSNVTMRMGITPVILGVHQYVPANIKLHG